jgi:prevent-host-death family protein
VNWHLQDAKNQLSKVVQRARDEGPQTITLRGKRAAVVLSAEEYDKLAGKKPNFIEFLLSGPAWDDEFAEEVNRRDKSAGRDIEF